MAEKCVSNYEKVIRDWAEKMKTMDFDDALRRIPGLRREGDRLVAPYFGGELALTAPEMTITALSGRKADMTDRLNYYTLLWFCKGGTHLTGNWLPFGSLRGAGPFDPAFRRTTLRQMADTFCSHPGELAAACEKLGGTPLSVSDVGYEIPSFDCLPVRLLFWDGDDEFPANVNILFDESAPDFIHVESVTTIAGALFAHLSDAAGLPMAGTAFEMK